MIVLGTVLGVCVIIYTINCVLVSRTPEMGMEFGSTKRNRRLVSGLPTDGPLFCFWGLLKTVPVGLNWTKNIHVWCV